MPRAESTLVGVYRRYGGAADRLTELLAASLQLHIGFAAALLARADVRPAAIEQVEVTTQVRTDVGRRVDLEVIGYSGGSPVALLWSENKAGAAYQDDQLGSYQRSLAALPAPATRRLITIVNAPGEASPQAAELGVPVLTWSEIGRLAWSVADHEHPGGRWRDFALDPNSPGRLRVLVELITYLEEEHNVSLDPVTFEHVRALQLANETSEVLSELLERTAQMMTTLTPSPDGVGLDTKNDWGTYWHVFEGGPTWIDDLSGYAEVVVSESDEWTEDRIDQPAIGAGAALPNLTIAELLAQADWRQLIGAKGFAVGVLGDMPRLYRTVYLAELPSKGVTLDAQARWLAGWVEESVLGLTGLAPAASQAASNPASA